MILACQSIHKSFGEDEILHDISFHIEPGEKVALTGVNGSGKSTLLNIITGELSSDSGEILFPKGTKIGFLKQSQNEHEQLTIWESLCTAKKEIFELENEMHALEARMKHASGEQLESYMSAYSRLTHSFEINNGYAARSELQGVFRGLGFSEEDMDRTMSTLSGGQKTRVALGRILLQAPDLILLDEPTNHLDMDAISWLENYLSAYQGAVLVVSHDRYFLDRIVTKVVEIEHGTALSYQGNYTSYSQKKAEVRRAMQKAYEKQQDEIKRQEAIIAKFRQFNREKSIRQAESREKALQSMEKIKQPQHLNADMNLKLNPRYESGKDVLRIHELSKSFGGLKLFEHQNIELFRGERLAVIGKNGTGKTTLLKMISGLEMPDSGSIEYGSKLSIGYFDQEHQQLDPEKTIFEEISDEYPALNNTEIRSVLAAFLFTGDTVFQPIKTLSGGEQGRVSLAKLMLSEANLLILDEPTNHLDMVSKEILEDALCRYTGTILYVSHDRYFINRTATRILDLVDGQFINYIGNYDYYLEKRDLLTSIHASAPVEAEEPTQTQGAKLDWKEQKAAQAKERKRLRRIEAIEKEISDLEEKQKEIEEEFNLPETGTNLARCQELSKEDASISETLNRLYEEWEQLSEE